jgi:hypothetical protein
LLRRQMLRLQKCRDGFTDMPPLRVGTGEVTCGYGVVQRCVMATCGSRCYTTATRATPVIRRHRDVDQSGRSLQTTSTRPVYPLPVPKFRIAEVADNT